MELRSASSAIRSAQRFLGDTKEARTDYRPFPSLGFLNTSLMNWIFGVSSENYFHGSDWQNNQLTGTAIWIFRRSHQVCRSVSPIYYITPLIILPSFWRNIPIFKRLLKNEFPILSDVKFLRSVREQDGRKYVNRPDIVISSLTL